MESNPPTQPSVAQLLLQLAALKQQFEESQVCQATLKQNQPQHHEPLKRTSSVGTDPYAKKPWVPGGVSVRSKANKADAAAAITPSSSPPGPSTHGEGLQTPASSTFSVSKGPRRVSSSPRRVSRSPRRVSSSPQRISPRAAPPAGPGRNPSPTRGCSGACNSPPPRSTVSTSAGVSRRDARGYTAFSSECAGLPYQEALQLAYGPPASPPYATHADCVAVVTKKASCTVKKQPCVNQVTSSTSCSGSKPVLPSYHSSKGRHSSVSAAAGAEAYTATSAAVAAALGVVVASALLAKGDRAAAAPQHSTAEQQQELLEVLKGYTSGYIDGRLAAMKGSRKSSSTDGGELPAKLLPSELATQEGVGGSSKAAGYWQLASPAQHPASATATAGNYLSAVGESVGGLAMPCAVASTTSSSPSVDSCMGPAQTIRPELVKRITLRIVSAALAAPDTASTACTTPAADAARALALSSPGQQRRLTLPEQVQQLPQRPCSPGLALLQGRESMQEFSVSAFDHETAAYLIPVSHIGCQTSEVFSPVLPTAGNAATGSHQQQPLNSCSAHLHADPASMQLCRGSAPSSSLNIEAPQQQRQQQQDAPHMYAGDPLGRPVANPQVGTQQQRQLLHCEPSGQPDEQQSDHDTGLPAAAAATATAAAAAQGAALSPAARSMSQLEQLLDIIQARATHKMMTGRQVQELQEPQSPLSPHLASSSLAWQEQDTTDLCGALDDQQGGHWQMLAAVESQLQLPLPQLLLAVEQQQSPLPPQQSQLPLQQSQLPLPQQQQQQQAVHAQQEQQEQLVSSERALAVTGASAGSSGQEPTSPLPGSRLELVVAELGMLQSAVRDHAVVDQLALSRLDALTAEVARLHRVLAERRSSVQPTSPQPPALQPLTSNLTTWSAQAAGVDPTQQAPGCPHSMPVCPDSSWCSSTAQPDIIDARASTPRSDGAAASGVFAPVVSPAAVVASACQLHPAGSRPASAAGVASMVQQPEQQVLAPILSAGLIRSRTVSGTLGSSWPAELPPVLEGRESDDKDSDCSSTQKPPAQKPSTPQPRSTDTRGSQDACTPSGSGQQDKKQAESFSLLRHASGWLSPRSRAGSLAVPVTGSPRSKASSNDCLRSPRSPTSPGSLATVSCSDSGAAPAELQLHAAAALATTSCPVNGSSTHRWPALSPRSRATGAVEVCGDGSGPSSAEKKRGFMMALKQSLNDNMQQLGSSRGSPGRLGKGGSKKDAQQ